MCNPSICLVQYKQAESTIQPPYIGLCWLCELKDEVGHVTGVDVVEGWSGRGIQHLLYHWQEHLP